VAAERVECADCRNRIDASDAVMYLAASKAVLHRTCYERRASVDGTGPRISPQRVEDS
jgi:hypothetical protein